jgi:PEP-CTERM motif
MKKFFAISALALMSASAAQAGVVRFDDAWTALLEGGKPASYYQGAHGMTISGTYYGLSGGNGNGDPGNWNLAGTNGSAFLGCNSGASCSPTFTFSNTVSSLSLDVGLPGFGWAATMTLTALLNGSIVDTDSINVSSPSDPGKWATLSVDGAFDSVRVGFVGTGGGAFAFGLDNIVYSVASNDVPEPSSLALLALVASGLVGARRLRRPQA